jgi:hypothetical protein
LLVYFRPCFVIAEDSLCIFIMYIWCNKYIDGINCKK